MPDPAQNPAPRQRIEGDLQRSLSASIAIRAMPEGQADDGLLRLRLSAASETPLPRYDWSLDDTVNETLGMGADEVDLTRMNTGVAPVLGNHNRYTAIGATPLAGIGSVERAWVEDARLMLDIIISRREALADLRQDIADGLVRAVSIGARPLERVLISQTAGQPAEYRITRWEPFEVSLVDVPLDISVGINRSGAPTDPPTQPQYRWVDIPPAGAAGTTLERTMPSPMVPYWNSPLSATACRSGAPPSWAMLMFLKSGALGARRAQIW